jgi:EF hand
MWRWAGGAVSVALLATAGVFVWRAQAGSPSSPVPAVPVASAAAVDAPLGIADLAGPPTASEKTREEKRFARYDKDKNGQVARDEYLASRQKAFARLDVNGDGRLSLDEYAVKAVVKFAAADRDKTGALNATEFASTRVVRKARPKPKCLPAPRTPAAAEDDQES